MLGIQGGSLIGVLFNLAKGGFGLLGSAIVSVGKLLLGNPIVLAVAAIAGAAYLIYQYWTPIKAFSPTSGRRSPRRLIRPWRGWASCWPP